MSAKHAVLLGLVVIDSLTKGIRFREAGTTATVDIAEGVYFVRGNGGATDLLAAIKTALESIAGTNTYSVGIAFNAGHSNPTAVVTITRASGANDFSVLWADALTTFDPALIGFKRTNSAHDAAAKVSTISPSSLWVASSVVNRLLPKPVFERTLEVSRGNVSRAVERASRRDRYWEQMLIHAMRMNEEDNTADPTATLGRFLERHADGKRLEFHQAELASGNTLNGLSAVADGTRVGTFIFTDDFYPSDGGDFAERDRSTPMHSFAGRLVRYHVADVEELMPLSGMTLWLDGSDATTFTEAGHVTQWRDKSGNARHVDDGDPNWAAMPTREAAIQNGLAAVRFASAGSAVSLYGTGTALSSIVTTSAFTAYTVLKPSSINGAAVNAQDNDLVWGHANGGFGLYLREAAGGLPPFQASFWNQDDSALFSSDIASADLVDETSACVIMVRHEAGTLYVSVNGGAEVSVASGNTVSSLSFPLILGRQSNTGTFFRGWLCELIAYNTAHDAATIEENIAYLRAKWGTP